MLFITVIEWDGKIPPTTYYNRLKKVAPFTVRGDKTLSPLTRRSGSGEYGVIMQEGCIVTPSESLARLVASYALESGALSVKTGSVQLDDFYKLSPSDESVINRLESVLGKRGRRNKTDLPRKMIVQCLEEGRSYQVESTAVITCPNCHGSNIVIREGDKTGVAYNPAAGLYANWINTRFYTGSFETPDIDPAAAIPADYAIGKIQAPIESHYAGLLADIAGKLESAGVDIVIATRILDGIFLNRIYTDPAARANSRLLAISSYFQAGFKPSNKFNIIESESPDLFDAGNIGIRTGQLNAIAGKIYNPD